MPARETQVWAEEQVRKIKRENGRGWVALVRGGDHPLGRARADLVAEVSGKAGAGCLGLVHGAVSSLA